MISKNQINRTWDIVVSSLTKVETEFFAPILRKFQEKGLRVAFILFDESACRLLDEIGIPYFNIYDLVRGNGYQALTGDALTNYLASFKIENIRNLYLHEKLGYNRLNEDALLQKTVHFLQVLDKLFGENTIRCIVQEVGGMAAYTTVYYAARKHNIPHVFHEPSCFPRRAFFNLNSFYSNLPSARPPSIQAREWSENYIKGYLQSGRVLIPVKDKHSYQDMKIGRMFNWMNAKRLSKKLYCKYIKGEREEFDSIGYVVRFNLLKLLRRFVLSVYYSSSDVLQKNERFIYYPLHVPHDVQLSVRSKLFYFQEAFVEYLSRVLPPGYRLYIKEHPAAIGAHPFILLRRLLKKHTCISLIHPTVNSYDLIQKAALIVTVNSKVGFEALLQNKKVIVLGQSFYRSRGVTFDVDNLADLEKEIVRAIESTPPERQRIIDFVAQAYENSYPYELLDWNPENLEVTFTSFARYLSQIGVIQIPFNREAESAV